MDLILSGNEWIRGGCESRSFALSGLDSLKKLVTREDHQQA
jgi:hypothetical protein